MCRRRNVCRRVVVEPYSCLINFHNNLLPKSLQNTLALDIKKSDIHSYNTRSSSNYRSQPSRTIPHPSDTVYYYFIIKLSFIARLNKNNLAQKRVTEKCLIITQFE